MTKKGLFTVILVVMLVMGIGLGAVAYWTNVLTVDNQVTTGSLNVIYIHPSYLFGFASWVQPDPVNPLVISGDQKSITCKVKNLYPGGYYRVYMTILNKGTIPAKIKDITITNPDLQPWLSATANAFPAQIDPGHTGSGFVYVKLDEAAPNGTENKTANIGITMNWKQFNQP